MITTQNPDDQKKIKTVSAAGILASFASGVGVGFFVPFILLSENIVDVDSVTFISAVAAGSAAVVSQFAFVFYTRQKKALFN